MADRERPLLQVVRGDATAEEIAALVTALAVARATAERTPRTAGERAAARSAWCDRSHLMRAPLAHGPGAWLASRLPG